MAEHFHGREALAQAFADAALAQSTQLSLMGDDASFRRYFRVGDRDGGSYVLMDAPPSHEDAAYFAHLAAVLRQHGQLTPKIVAQDDKQGFLLMEDFGDEWLFYRLRDDAETTMRQALRNLHHWQTQTRPLQSTIAAYDRERLMAEMALFQQWFVPHYLNYDLSADEQSMLLAQQQWLCDIVLAQPSACVHRDYHSRNLMCLPNGDLGIIDFQDMVWGAVSYDLVSITRDCYIAYAPEQVRRWEAAFARAYFPQIDFEQWHLICEATALQRHLKVLGIFVRLAVRDKKPRYLADLGLCFAYALQEAQGLDECQALAQLLAKLQPLFQARMMRDGEQAS